MDTLRRTSPFVIVIVTLFAADALVAWAERERDTMPALVVDLDEAPTRATFPSALGALRSSIAEANGRADRTEVGPRRVKARARAQCRPAVAVSAYGHGEGR